MKKILTITLIFLATLAYLIACDDSGNDSKDKSSAAKYKIFVTESTTDGNIGGISGADALCMADSNKPDDGKTYKAFLVDGANRVACTTNDCAGGGSEHTDWVLQPNAGYYRSDGTTLVFISNSNGIVEFPDDDPEQLINPLSVSGGSYWTGLEQKWTSAGNVCQNWITASNSYWGRPASKNALDANFIGRTFQLECDTELNITCVEQPDE